jgi:hypothetical protein
MTEGSKTIAMAFFFMAIEERDKEKKSIIRIFQGIERVLTVKLNNR